jgi:hypothetical protein
MGKQPFNLHTTILKLNENTVHQQLYLVQLHVHVSILEFLDAQSPTNIIHSERPLSPETFKSRLQRANKYCMLPSL